MTTGMKGRLLIFSLGRRGAAPNQTFELARALLKRREVVLSLCVSRQSDLRREIEALGLPTLVVSTYADLRGWELFATLWRLPLALLAFVFFLLKQKPDMVLCPMGHIWNPVFLPVMRLFGIRYALMVHDGLVKAGDHMSAPQRWNEIELRNADLLIAMTDFVRSQLVEGRHRKKEDVPVIPLGPFEAAAGQQISVSERATKIRREGIRELLFFGRILDYKGLDLLLEAFAQIEPLYPLLRLKIAGSGDIEPYRPLLARLAHVDLDLRYIPEEEVPAIFAGSDVVILPYKEATQSGVIAVAQTAGVPVIATPIGGLKEQIEDGVTGLLSRDVTADSLAHAIRGLLDDPILYEKISHQGQEYSRKLWDYAARDIAALVERTRMEKNVVT